MELDVQQMQLMLRHAMLTAQHAQGNHGVVPELQQIEAQLQMTAAEIARYAAAEYLRDYRG